MEIGDYNILNSYTLNIIKSFNCLLWFLFFLLLFNIDNKKSQASVSGKSFSFLKFFPTSEWVAGPGCRELWAGSLCWEKQVPRGTPLPPLTPPPGRPVPSLLADSLAVEACPEW